MLQPGRKQSKTVNPHLEFLNPYLHSLIPILHFSLALGILVAWKRDLPSLGCSKQQQNWNYHVLTLQLQVSPCAAAVDEDSGDWNLGAE